MKKELPKSSWVQFLNNFSKENENQLVKLYLIQNDQKNLLKEGHLVSFEGDCSGDIVKELKIVIGEEGDTPDNLFHYIKSPKNLSIEENEDTGLVESIFITNDSGAISLLELGY